MGRILFGRFVLIFVGAAIGVATLSLTRGQAPPIRLPDLPDAQPLTPSPRPTPGGEAVPVSAPLREPTSVRVGGPDLDKMPALTRQMYLTSQRGAEWLHRVNLPSGLFINGWHVALNRAFDGDHFLRQAEAAFGLARAARFFADERYTARARQAVLALLAETTTDGAEPPTRFTTYPAPVINRLASAGLLVMAINELPTPAADLLDQSEELCRFLQKQQKPDGSFRFLDTSDDAKPAATDTEAASYAGMALYGLMLSQRYKPADWKDAVVARAVVADKTAWKAKPTAEFVPYRVAAYSEAFLRTKNAAFSEFVFALADWTCSLQHEQLDPRHPLWRGGFMNVADGQPVVGPPSLVAGGLTLALFEACRVTRQAPDPQRFSRYKAAGVRGGQFLTTLQYTEDNTQHFAPAYRPMLVGGFHVSHANGDLRPDLTGQAVAALSGYLTHVADRP